MNLRDTPIRQKLTLVIMLTSSAVLFLTTVAFLSYELVSSNRNLLQNFRTIAQITAAQSSAAVSFEDERGCQKILSELQAEPKILLAALYARDGKLLARHPATADIHSFPPAPGPAEFKIQGKTLNTFMPVRANDQAIGALFIEWDLSQARRRMHWYGGMVIFVFLSSLGLALILSNWLQRQISVPVLELAETAGNVSRSGDYSVRAKKLGNDEVGLLTDAFNQMLTRIGEQDDELRRNQEELRHTLQAAQAAAREVRALNTELEDRVARRTAELAATNHDLEAFGYSVSHDLRAPLRHIEGYIRMLEQEADKDSADARQFRARILASAQNMARLVDDLLKLSRIVRAEFKAASVPLNTIVDEVIAELKPETAQRDIEWRIGPLPAATVDEGLIKRAFANLISNAVKFTRPRARAVIEIGLKEIDGAAAIFIRDNGVGFNQAAAHNLFGVFQRFHRGEDFEGTGVGLHTVQRIIRLHGGTIRAESEPDKGATFYFTLKGIETARSA